MISMLGKCVSSLGAAPTENLDNSFFNISELYSMTLA